MTQAHIAQVGFFKPVLDGLQDAGANVDGLIKHTGLNKFQLDDPEYYVPVNSMYAFFETIKCQQGITDRMIDIWPRTLQRRLAEEGISLSEVVDQWRFKSAIKMLAKGDIKIKDISTYLRYSNVPNFERAFRRWTNTRPTALPRDYVDPVSSVFHN